MKPTPKYDEINTRIISETGDFSTTKVFEYDKEGKQHINYRVSLAKIRVNADKDEANPIAITSIRTNQIQLHKNEQPAEMHTLQERIEPGLSLDAIDIANPIELALYSDGTSEGSYLYDKNSGRVVQNVRRVEINLSADKYREENGMTIEIDFPIFDVASRNYSSVIYETLPFNQYIIDAVKAIGK